MGGIRSRRREVTQFAGGEVGVLFLWFGAVLILCAALLAATTRSARGEPTWIAGLAMLIGGAAFALYGEYLRNQVSSPNPGREPITGAELAAGGVPGAVRTPGTLPLLGEILIHKYHLITERDLRRALALQVQSGRRLGQVLVEMGLLTHDDLERALEDQLSYGDPWHRGPAGHQEEAGARPTAPGS
jgi:hypothetical protein